MTGHDIYKMASAFLYERDGEDEESKEFSVSFLNTLLVECLPYENSIRRSEGTAELKSAPLLTSLDENIDFDNAITRIALPYGLAALYFAENLDNQRGVMYRSQYLAALNDAAKLTVDTVQDVYAVDGECHA